MASEKLTSRKHSRSLLSVFLLKLISAHFVYSVGIKVSSEGSISHQRYLLSAFSCRHPSKLLAQKHMMFVSNVFRRGKRLWETSVALKGLSKNQFSSVCEEQEQDQPQEQPSANLRFDTLEDEILHLQSFINDHSKITVLTGAGCSTDSGIPDYRGPNGSYSRGYKPMVHDQFMRSEYHRKRYWARTSLGWEKFSAAKPNPTHFSLAQLESIGKIQALITQNVDGLHQKAGSRNVIDLHGRNDKVICMNCGLKSSRRILQQQLQLMNPSWLEQYRRFVDDPNSRRSDGDVAIEAKDFDEFQLPCCQRCQGVLKPDVVFFGDNVKKPVVEEAYDYVHNSDAMLVVGTSLMVYSGFRFVKRAQDLGIPIAVINMGETRADKEQVPHYKFKSNSSVLLPQLDLN
mmetsp:Transcript_12802/g.16821  ORF Transcript_12802/g.16821 Transcript_12802/m.16821 type:complete len:401 (+) Transcript_12802:49-1251(+)